ncbi:L-threonine 3-dehydrogenase [Mesotoga prima MesG1.Ag.4.2]|uniref:L-threonine 3-dehydrogenase n=1 Tax=Mesotoga prima MesG1.Ag.4.2 TaxID=660470 RepID=I2F3V8_9BACT|nr:L-threonine 3-dehydrogenase [Mesotoga prima]AFK06611.1 L-threonine 3-dehydrogenase [Mesotoga prima MesG1.Ag.4.2]
MESETMIAIVKERPAPGLTLKRVPVPRELGPHDVLVKVKRASICGTDVHIYNWDAWSQERIRPPQIDGHEFTGEVVSIGGDVSSVKVGDSVVSETHIPCQKCLQCRTGKMHICKNMQILGVHRDGVFAEYVRVPEVVLWKVDPSIPLEYASIMEPFGNAIHTALVTDLTGKNVLITGAGPIGVMAVAVAKVSGAAQVIVSEIKEFRKELARKMGADVIIDPTKEDLTKKVKAMTEDNGADVLLEMSGNTTAFKQGLDSLTNGAVVSLLGVFPGELSFDINGLFTFKGLTMYGITGRKMFETWQVATQLLKNKRIDLSPVVTHVLPAEKFEEGFDVMIRGVSGKVILEF